MEQVLVTGGTGYIASHVIYQLLDQGYRVRATVRDKTSPRIAEFIFPNMENLEWVSADLTKTTIEEWVDVVQGCDFVLHMASPFTNNVKDVEAELIKPAVEGTKVVLDAVARATGVRNTVVTSSIAAVAVGHAEDSPVVDHTTWSVENDTFNYELSKLRAEKGAWEVADEKELPLSVVCPGFVMGPILAPCQEKAESELLFIMLMKNSLMFAAPIGFGVADVRDVAAIHIGAMLKTKPASDRTRYIAVANDGKQISVQELCEVMRAIVGTKAKYSPPRYTIPVFACRMMSLLKPALRTGFLGKSPRFDDSLVLEGLGIVSGTIFNAIYSQAMSSFRLNIIPSRGYPTEEFEAFSAYPSAEQLKKQIEIMKNCDSSFAKNVQVDSFNRIKLE